MYIKIYEFVFLQEEACQRMSVIYELEDTIHVTQYSMDLLQAVCVKSLTGNCRPMTNRVLGVKKGQRKAAKFDST